MTERLPDPEVYVVVGWFGDQEWIEAIYRTEKDAEAACARLWAERDSREGYGRLSKFGVDAWPLL